jgi:hypothetical protein
MAVGAKEPEVPGAVVEGVAVDVVDLQRQLLALPLVDVTVCTLPRDADLEHGAPDKVSLLPTLLGGALHQDL